MFLKRLAIIVLIIASAAFIAGAIFDRIYKKRWTVLFFEKTDTLVNGHTSYDIIFLGNSRMHFGVNPFYIDSATGLKSYNFGTGNADPGEMLMQVNTYLEKHVAPKVAVISLDMGYFTYTNSLRNRYHYLFYLHHDTIRTYMENAGFKTSFISHLPFMKYSFMDEYNRTSLFIRGRDYPIFDRNVYKGFLNIHQDINIEAASLYNYQKDSYRFWEPAVHTFRSLVTTLGRAGTRVVVVQPPEKKSSPLRQHPFRETADSIFQRISDEYQLKHLHFENETQYSDPYFVDDIHLNEPGTRLYSIQLGDSLKKLFPATKQPPGL